MQYNQTSLFRGMTLRLGLRLGLGRRDLLFRLSEGFELEHYNV